jgi:hypothetical protein
MRAPIFTVVFALLAASVHAGTPDHSFTGYARSLDSGELLYIESHAVSGAGGELLKAQIDFPQAAQTSSAVDLAALHALPLAACGDR